MFKSTLILLLFRAISIKCSLVNNLGGSWRFSDLNGEYQDLPALVPGGIYSDLMQNNVIGDVFSGYNDVKTRWVAKRDWKYHRNFTVDQNFLSYQRINLVFDGLDTFASVRINNEEILTSDNMFVQYIVDVTSILKAGENLIEVVFKSAVEEAQRLYEEQLKDYTVFPTCVPEKYNGECHVNHIRKMQASFSWDWGPALPSVGIWKPLYLEAYNSTVIRDIIVETTLQSSTSSWNVSLKIYFEDTPINNKTISGTIAANLNTDVTEIAELLDVVINKNEDGEFIATLNFTIPALQVSLWWPNGYGLQNLYALNVTFTSNEGETTSKNVKIGFRTITLIQDKIDGGRAFYFEVNNVAMFAKGTNSIPINILPERGQNETVVRFLLQSAKDVHMNMIRVWGGGVYESDAFYEIADELGILIWQDFMFACSMYPTKINYLESVRREVRHQVRRLQHHASVALWAANNENEAALRDSWYGTYINFKLYAKDYVTLYVNTVRDEALKNDDTRDFLTSSPTNGIESEREGYIAQNPYSWLYGDVHFYNYGLNSWNKNNYPRTRFASEYGFQAMPQLESWWSVTDNITNLHADSDFLDHRQHLPGGNVYLDLLITYELDLPEANSPNYINVLLFYSQVIQAVAIKHQTEYYRQWKSIINSDYTGLTMGALYWQLNDVWVAPTWAGIDFQNRWKMMHYYAKDFFAPIIVTGHLKPSKELDIYLVSDVLTTFYNTTLSITVYNWSSLNPVFKQRVITDIWSNVSKKVFSIWIDSYLASFPECKTNLSDDNTKCFIYLSLADSNNKALAPNNFVFPVTLKTASLVKPNLQISSVVQTDTYGKEFSVTVTTDVITLFVWLNSSSIYGRFSENGFLQVQANKTVNFYADVATDVPVLSVTLSVTNLLDDKFL